MKPYRAKTPKIFSRLYSKRIWSLPARSKTLYLTFDDGPIPQITPWVLGQLKHYNALATFFCIGDNVVKHPDILKAIVNQGHRIGNHTQNHRSAFKQTTAHFITEVTQCNEAIATVMDSAPSYTKLFRPPYGKLKSTQAKALYKRGYQVVMWDVLSADFDQNISSKTCLDNVLNHAKPGSIIVFHDSIKAQERLQFALPLVLAYFTKKGFEFKCIP